MNANILTRHKTRAAVVGLSMAGLLAAGGGLAAQGANAATCGQAGSNCVNGSYAVQQTFSWGLSTTTLTPWTADGANQDSTTSSDSYTVTTNDPNGWTVTSQATASHFMSGATQGVPVSDLSVWGPKQAADGGGGCSGSGCGVPVSSTSPIITDQSSAAAPSGSTQNDSYGFAGVSNGGTNFSDTQSVPAGTYSISLQYVGVAR